MTKEKPSPCLRWSEADANQKANTLKNQNKPKTEFNC